MLDVDAVRDCFPALSGGAAYLDGPGGSQVPADVLEAISACLTETNANLGGAFATSEGAVEVMARGRAALADFTGGHPDGIAFGANMTTLNFLLAHAVARTLQPGDEIVVTQLDHDANISPWLLVAADHGLTVRTAPIDTGDVTLDHDALEALIGERTRVVAFTLASNAVGSLTDPARIAAAAHAVGALAWADGVHLAPHRRLRASEWGLDVLLCSPYKFFGPHLGVAAIRPELAESLPADRVRPAGQDPPGHRFETGTQSFEAVAGAAAAVEYLRSLGDGDPATAWTVPSPRSKRTRTGSRGASWAGCLQASSCTGSPARRRAQPRSASTWATGDRARWPRRSGAGSCTCGTATTTRSSRSARSGWPSAAARCARVSSTTPPRTRSTGCLGHSASWRAESARFARRASRSPAATRAGSARCPAE